MERRRRKRGRVGGAGGLGGGFYRRRERCRGRSVPAKYYYAPE